ncbi:hypothetical protein L226DRAFT_527016 [Lentinus tigrinus ALCF2SS1-7]|uniref:uncharacterized protein n=1 Tax=Lentinus tigrinus ALCF2SS1-7 TaxID=1328758 RepID=UPI001165C9A9|nr:hypothetical protein L226DRAFT_527016 [Lentinus tigrinus ALCF2SS1-7]
MRASETRETRRSASLKLRVAESQLACAQWRSHARKYSKQRLYSGRDLATGFAHQLAERIAHLLTVAGSSTSSDDICATYTSHLETIVRTALKLQRTIGEEVTSSAPTKIIPHATVDQYCRSLRERKERRHPATRRRNRHEGPTARTTTHPNVLPGGRPDRTVSLSLQHQQTHQ